MHKVEQMFPLEMHFNDILLKVDQVQPKSLIAAMDDRTQQKSTTGMVVAIGPYVARETTIRPGQRIKFRKLAGEEVEWDEQKYLIILANDVRFTIHAPQTTNEQDGPTLRSV